MTNNKTIMFWFLVVPFTNYQLWNIFSLAVTISTISLISTKRAVFFDIIFQYQPDSAGWLVNTSCTESG